MLDVQGLSKRYRGLPALDNMSFRVGPDEIIGYVGPNGSGKSTTVKIITDLLEPNEGKVLFEGLNIRDDLTGYRAAFGSVPEEAISTLIFLGSSIYNLSAGCATRLKNSLI